MNRFEHPQHEPELTREQDAVAYEVAQARQIAANMRQAMEAMDNTTSLGGVIEDCAAQIEVAAWDAERDYRLPPGPRVMLALGDYVMGVTR
jgi:methylthioribose-1-phosphate isomerase